MRIFLLIYVSFYINCINCANAFFWRKPPSCKLSDFPPDPRSQCCGVDSTSSNRIFGGHKTGLRQYPWLAIIEYEAKKDQSIGVFCGGFLISGRYVLTAAHCVSGAVLKEGEPVSVRLGDYDKDHRGPDCISEGDGKDCTKGSVRIPIRSITIHPDYRNMTRNDIALIRLKWLARYTDQIRPICLPMTDVTDHLPENHKLWIAGWGHMAYSNGRRGPYEISSSVKRHVSLPYMPIKKCHTLWGATVGKKHICAGGEKGRSSCKGDSGGPLMFEDGGIFTAVGISSFVSAKDICGQSSLPNVFTKIYDYIPWLSVNIVH